MDDGYPAIVHQPVQDGLVSVMMMNDDSSREVSVENIQGSFLYMDEAKRRDLVPDEDIYKQFVASVPKAERLWMEKAVDRDAWDHWRRSRDYEYSVIGTRVKSALVAKLSDMGPSASWLAPALMHTMASILGVKPHKATCVLCGKCRQSCTYMVCGRPAMDTCVEVVLDLAKATRTLLMSDDLSELASALNTLYE